MNAKTDVTKLACALQTILNMLICACVMTVETALRVYTKEEGEIEFGSDDEDGEKEWTLAQIDVLIHFIHICSNDVKVCITFFISC